MRRPKFWPLSLAGRLAGFLRRLVPVRQRPRTREVSEDPSGRLKVYVFNVGQGDHILLELPNGEYGVIDFYYEGSVGLKRPPALTYLESVRLRHPSRQIVISFVCISHPDFDHVKGAEGFLRWAEEHKVKVNNLWLPGGNDFGEMYEEYVSVIRKYARDERERHRAFDFKSRLEGITRYLGSRAWAGHVDYLQGAVRQLSADAGGGIQVVLLAPLTRHVRGYDRQLFRDLLRSVIENRKNTTAQTNLVSSVLLMSLNRHKLLFGGDTGLDIWLECLDEYDRGRHQKNFGPYRANFIKVSHHGSRNSSSPALWGKLLEKNTYAGVSAGRKYGHPHGQTLRDIGAAAQAGGSRAETFSTNVCTGCLHAQDIPSEELEGFGPDYIFPPQVAQTLRWVSPRSHADRRQSLTLGAYIFRFSVNSDKVTVTKGMIPTRVGAKGCIYNRGTSGPFPACAP